MAEILKANPIALRQIILYEALGGTPPFIAWKKFCKRIGDDVMDYIDYEFWFMRFANKQFDLEYDRSLEPKRMNIQEMPTEMLMKIFGKVSLMKRVNIQNTSQRFRAVLNELEPAIKSIAVEVSRKEVEVKITRDPTKCDAQRWNIIQTKKSSMATAAKDLAGLFKHPRLHLEAFEISGMDYEGAAKILPRLDLSKVDELGVLISINTIYCIPDIKEESLEKICKVVGGAKHVTVDYVIGQMPIEYFMNLRNFCIRFGTIPHGEDFDAILTKIQTSTVLEKFTLDMFDVHGAFMHIAERKLFRKVGDGRSETYRSPNLENENAYIEIERFEDKIVVTKVRF